MQQIGLGEQDLIPLKDIYQIQAMGLHVNRERL